MSKAALTAVWIVCLFLFFLGLNMRTVAGPIVMAISAVLLAAAVWRTRAHTHT